ncbi:phage holin family protein [Pseudescherichia sp.]|uniref:phage holin family protein n=2 Tax=Enterobacteriaceae TaxID=543 RepID=UPI003917486B
MNKMPYKSDPNFWSILIAFGMTIIGAIASYSFKVLGGEVFSWRTLCLQLIVSIFAGLTMALIAVHYSWPPEVMGATCGLAGWAGSSFIKSLEKRFLSKVSGKEEAND